MGDLIRKSKLIVSGLVVLLALTLACEKAGQEHEHASPPADAAKQSRGKDLYARHGCAGCHGISGRGDGPAATGLSSKPRDFRDRSNYKQGAKLEQIKATLRTGVKGSAMVGYDHLSVVELNLLARYVVFLQGQP